MLGVFLKKNVFVVVVFEDFGFFLLQKLCKNRHCVAFHDALREVDFSCDTSLLMTPVFTLRPERFLFPLFLCCSYLPALNVGLQLFQSLQFLHLPLGLIDVGADSLHGLQSLFHCWIVSMLLRGPL